MKALLELDAAAGPGSTVLDHDFIAQHTNGFDAFAADLRATTWADIERACGLPRSALEVVAQAYARSNATIVTYGMGITQHVTGTANVQQIANLLLLRGNIGKPGAGICPLRGHSNVQGDRTVGITEKPPAFHAGKHRENLRLRAAEAAWARCGRGDAGDRRWALESADLPWRQFRHRLAGSGTMPWPAMRKLDLAVHLNTKLNRSHLLVGKEFDYPAGARPHRTGCAGQRPAGGHGGGFDVDGARLARQTAARLGKSALRTGDRRRHGDGDPALQQGSVAGHG